MSTLDIRKKTKEGKQKIQKMSTLGIGIKSKREDINKMSKIGKKGKGKGRTRPPFWEICSDAL